MAASSAPSSPSNLSSVTLVGSAGSGSGSGSGSDPSPQEGPGNYSRTVSEETDTPLATEGQSNDGSLFKIESYPTSTRLII